MTSLVVCGSFQFVNYFYFYVNKEKVYIKEFFKLLPSYNGKYSSIQLLLEETLRPFSNLTISKERQYLEDLILISSKFGLLITRYKESRYSERLDLFSVY